MKNCFVPGPAKPRPRRWVAAKHKSAAAVSVRSKKEEKKKTKTGWQKSVVDCVGRRKQWPWKTTWCDRKRCYGNVARALITLCGYAHRRAAARHKRVGTDLCATRRPPGRLVVSIVSSVRGVTIIQSVRVKGRWSPRRKNAYVYRPGEMIKRKRGGGKTADVTAGKTAWTGCAPSVISKEQKTRKSDRFPKAYEDILQLAWWWEGVI